MSAWQWLSAPPDVQWSSLMNAVEYDLEARQPLWNTFRYPKIQRIKWQVVRQYTP